MHPSASKYLSADNSADMVKFKQRIAKVIALFILVPLLVLTCVRGIEYLCNPKQAYLIPEFTVVATDGSVAKIPPRVKLQNGQYKLDQYDEGPVVFTADISDILARYEDPAILISKVYRRAIVQLDGIDLGSSGANESPARFKRYEPHFFSLVRESSGGVFDQSGILKITVDAKGNKPLLRSTYIDEVEPLASAYRWRRFFGVDIVIAAMGISLLVSLIVITMVPVATNKSLLLSFAAVMFCWGLHNAALVGPFSRFSQTV